MTDLSGNWMLETAGLALDNEGKRTLLNVATQRKETPVVTQQKETPVVTQHKKTPVVIQQKETRHPLIPSKKRLVIGCDLDSHLWK